MILELATRDMKSREKHLFERISRVITGVYYGIHSELGKGTPQYLVVPVP